MSFTSSTISPVPDYAGLIQQASAQTGVPTSIIQSVSQWESGQGTTTSNLMGLTSPVASQLGVNPNSPGQNILGGATLLQQLYAQYGNWTAALSAYNTGSPTSPAGLAYAQNVLNSAGLGNAVPATTASGTPATTATGSGITFYVVAIVLIIGLVLFGMFGLIKD